MFVNSASIRKLNVSSFSSQNKLQSKLPILSFTFSVSANVFFNLCFVLLSVLTCHYLVLFLSSVFFLQLNSLNFFSAPITTQGNSRLTKRAEQRLENSYERKMTFL